MRRAMQPPGNSDNPVHEGRPAVPGFGPSASWEILRLRVHPQDLALIQQALEARETPEKVEVVADPSFERGGLVIETARGNLDASIDSQLLEIERGFTDLVRRSNR